jgi:hypothetical protein
MLHAAACQFSSSWRSRHHQPKWQFVKRHRIFNKLCIAYRRSRQDPEFGIRVDDLKIELDISEHVFAEALGTFIDANAEMIVEVYETKGERYVRLGQTARYNCSD